MSDKAPESPTTVKPLDYSDDEDNQESGVTNMDSTTTKPAAATTTRETSTTPATTATSTTAVLPPSLQAAAIPPTTTTSNSTAATNEAPPPKPPRPVTEQQKNEAILKEAFPSIEASVIKAVLIASGGRIDPAFNALLGMSDPDAVQPDVEDEVPPPQPPRPQRQQQHTAQSQLEADEAYARQLAEHYESSAYEARTSNRGYPPAQPRRRQQTGLKPNELYDDREHSFIDDDLPVIQEQLKKGFQETQVKVNSWFKDLKKKFDEQFDEDGEPSSSAHQQQQQQQQQHGGQYGRGRPTRDASRRERDYERYDADPELLSDDFAGMKFHSDGTPARTNQPNPNVFRPPPSSTSPKPSDGRKVAFKEGAEEIDLYGASPKNGPRDATATSKTSKWQPLSNVDPDPIADHDHFSLGDSDDEKDKSSSKGGIKMDDSEERLRKAAAEAMSDSLVDDKAKKDEAK